MGTAKPDRRVKRTQKSLHVALNTLILEKGYEATSIRDIVSHANVGRSTLYAHHGGKEGLLLNGLEHLRAALLACQPETLTSREGKKDVLAFSGTFFEHIHEYRGILTALQGTSGGSAVLRGMRRVVADLVRNELGTAKSESRNDDIPRDAVIQFTVDAMFSVLLWWFERSPNLSPAHADTIFRRLVLPGLAAARLL